MKANHVIPSFKNHPLHFLSAVSELQWSFSNQPLPMRNILLLFQRKQVYCDIYLNSNKAN